MWESLKEFFSGPKPASRERVFPKIHVYLQLFPPLALRFPVERKKIDGGLSKNGDGERAGREKEKGEIGEKAEAWNSVVELYPERRDTHPFPVQGFGQFTPKLKVEKYGGGGEKSKVLAVVNRGL